MRSQLALALFLLVGCAGAKTEPRTVAPPSAAIGGGPSPAGVPHGDEDMDGDGIPNSADNCPMDAEDFDGFHDKDGCPEPDNDHDGIADMADKCPNEAETKNGYQDEDGCPEHFNSQNNDPDGDHVVDIYDMCPDEPEDFDGFQDQDGCPDLDNDQDGVFDKDDKCPDKPGPASKGGCP